MQKLNILNSRDIKKIRKKIIDFYGYFTEKDYAYLKTEKGKIYLINKDLVRIDLTKIKIDKLGLYFAEEKGESIRLSKEGAQFLYNEGKDKLKNVVELDSQEMKRYFKGEDLEKDLGKENRFILLKFKDDVFSCAKYKDGTILNFLPKMHRGEVIL